MNCLVIPLDANFEAQTLQNFGEFFWCNFSSGLRVVADWLAMIFCPSPCFCCIFDGL